MKKTILKKEIRHLRVIGDNLKKEFKHLEKLNFHLVKHDKETNIITLKVFSHKAFTIVKTIFIAYFVPGTREHSHYTSTKNKYTDVFEKNSLKGMTYRFDLNAEKVILI